MIEALHLAMTPEQELIALRRKVADLQSELAEYRRRERPQDDQDLQLRWIQVRTALGGDYGRRQACGIILMLAERPGRAVQASALRRAISGDWEEKSEKVLHVAVVHARGMLRPHGLRIETIHGVGYRMPLADAETVNRLIESAGRAP